MSSLAPASWPQEVLATLDRPSGAHSFRCAFQVNPWDYVVRHAKSTSFTSADQYDAAIVQACLDTGTTVVGLADHHSVETSRGLRAGLEAAGVHVFPGFEVCCKDGVHMQVLFEPGTTEHDMTLKLGAVGADPADPNGQADVDVPELLRRVDEWGAVAIAGQLTYRSGILAHLQGKSRQRVWTDSRLLAGAIPAPVAQIALQGHRKILENIEPGYVREFPVALLHANDVCDPQDLQKLNRWSWIKMVQPTIEGLRSAFRDPESRVHLPTEPQPAEHPQLVAIGWDGAACHLSGSRLHLNADLNVLVGGRGAGKSTVLESIRFVLGEAPTGPDSIRSHKRIVEDVLQQGTRVWLVVRSTGVTSRDYLIERVVGGVATVSSRDGQRLDLDPIEAFPGAEIWGQREISELTWEGTARNRLLSRFVTVDRDSVPRKREVAKQLEQNRLSLVRLRQETSDLDDRVAALPALEEQASRYAEAGIEQRLRQQSQLVRERALLDAARERLEPLQALVAALPEAVAPDLAFLSAAAQKPLANPGLLEEARAVLDEVASVSAAAVAGLSQVAAEADRRLVDIRRRWEERVELADQEHAARLRALPQSDADGQAYLELRRQLERLGPLGERRNRLEAELQLLQQQRVLLLGEWQAARDLQVVGLRDAADLVNSRLAAASVRVTVTQDGDTGPLESLLRERVGGNLSKTISALQQQEVTAGRLAQLCRSGAEALAQALGTSPSQAEKLCQAGPALAEELEQLDLQPVTEVQLKVGNTWRSQDRLSKGQQATAFLLLLLVGGEGAGPLLVDQPEEDLDNRFITDSIVPAMRREKRRRQFLFTSHNPNIPVLGDAELIAEVRVEMVPDGKGTEELRGRVGPPARSGSIDTPAVRELVEETLEGGRLAFARRRRKYGF